MRKFKNLKKRGTALLMSALMVASIIPADSIKVKAAVTDTTSVSYAIIDGTEDVSSVGVPTNWTKTNVTLTTALNVGTRDNRILYIKLNEDITSENYDQYIRVGSKYPFSSSSGGIVLDLAGHKVTRDSRNEEAGFGGVIRFNGIEHSRITSSEGRGTITGAKQVSADKYGAVFFDTSASFMNVYIDNVDITGNEYNLTGNGDLYPLEILNPSNVVLDNVTVSGNTCTSSSSVPWCGVKIQGSTTEGKQIQSIEFKNKVVIDNNLWKLKSGTDEPVNRGLNVNSDIYVARMSADSKVTARSYTPTGSTANDTPMFVGVSADLMKCIGVDDAQTKAVYTKPESATDVYLGKARKITYYLDSDLNNSIREYVTAPFTLLEKPEIKDADGNDITDWYFIENGKEVEYDFNRIPEEHSISIDGDTTSIVMYGRKHIHNGDSEWKRNRTHHWHECTLNGCVHEDGIYGQEEHDMKEVVDIIKDSTGCNDVGRKVTYTQCAICNYEQTGSRKEEDFVNHSNVKSNVQSERASTCSVEGERVTVTKCEDCGTVIDTKVEKFPKLSHTPGSMVRENIITGTCTISEAWDEVVRCTVCNEIISSNHHEVPADGHQPGESHIEDYVPATCTQPGGYNEVVRCTVCDEIISSEVIKDSDPLGHNEGTGCKENVVPATCYDDGSYDWVVYCTRCNEELSRESKVDPCVGHKPGAFVKENFIPATCEEGGSYDAVVRCSVCEEILSSASVIQEKLGHNYSKNDPVVTWSEDNKHATLTVNCSRCGEKSFETDVTYVSTATCVDTGRTIYTAKFTSPELDKEYSFNKTEDLKPLGHDMELIPFNRATCCEEGNRAYYHCLRCDNYYSDKNATISTSPDKQTIPVDTLSGHVGRLVEGVEPTCMDYGQKPYYICEHCDYMFETENGCKYDAQLDDDVSSEITDPSLLVLPKSDHKLISFDSVRPTCTSEGHTAYWQCEFCEKYFNNSQGVGAGFSTEEQFLVGKADHVLVTHEAVPASCVHTGNKLYYTCNVCEGYFVDDPENEGKYIEADYEEDIVLPLEEHSWHDTTDPEYLKVVATCTTPAEYYQKCDNCTTKDSEHVSTDYSATGHIMSQHVERLDPTCVDQGNREYFLCGMCGKYFADSTGLEELSFYPEDDDPEHEHCVILEATGHAYENEVDEDYLKSSATCAKAAVYYSKCKDCGARGPAFETDIYEAHKLENVPKTEPTCEKNGNVEYWKCTECNHVFSKNIGNTPSTDWTTLYSRVIPKLNHAYVKTAIKEATCTENGKYVDRCSRCGVTTPEYDFEKLYHNYGEPEFTWNEDYSKCTAKFTCGREECGHVESYTISKGQNGYEHIDRQETCEEDGEYTFKATFNVHFADVKDEDNDLEYVAEEKVVREKLGHDYSEHVSDNNANCTHDGTKTAVCSRCGAKDVIDEPGTMDPNKHVWTEDYVITKQPTCQSAGKEAIKCKFCTVIKEEREVPKTEHQFLEKAYVSNNDATCENDGTKTAYCMFECGTKDTIVDEGTAFGHEFGEYEEESVADCTHDGVKIAHCTREGCDGVDEIRTPKTGHKYSEYVSDKNATCKMDGTKTATCSKCGDKDTIVDTGSKKTHKFTGYVSNKDATCDKDGTKTGKCEYCGLANTLPDAGTALGHVWAADYTVDKVATQTEDGVKSIHCTRCNAKTGETVIPKNSPNTVVKQELPMLFARGVGANKKITLKWKKVSGASGYEVYYSNCKSNNYKLLKDTKSASYTHAKLTNKSEFKYVVVAYKMAAGQKTYLAKSVTIHTAMKGQSATNAKAVTVNKSSVSLSKGKSFKIKATIKKENKKKNVLKHEGLIRYYTSDKKVAVVDKKGKITAKGTGSCSIYVVANNGIYKAVKVKVK